MSNQEKILTDKQVYQIQGFSCANCAATFEKNVKGLDGVIDAKVNFGASKLTVYGEATIEEIKKAGAFERLQVSPENTPVPFEKTSFIKKHWQVLCSVVFLGIGWSLSGINFDLSLIFYLASVVLGGYRLFNTGIRNLFRLQFDMRTLMTIAVIGAAIIGKWEEAAIVVILFAISEALESYSMDKARSSIRSLVDLAPKAGRVRREGKEITVDVQDIVKGDIMLVKPGQENRHGWESRQRNVHSRSSPHYW